MAGESVAGRLARIGRDVLALEMDLREAEAENVRLISQLGLAWVVMAYYANKINAEEAADVLCVSVEAFHKCCDETMKKGLRMLCMVQGDRPQSDGGNRV